MNTWHRCYRGEIDCFFQKVFKAQAGGNAYGFEVDLWSLGVFTFVMLWGAASSAARCAVCRSESEKHW